MEHIVKDENPGFRPRYVTAFVSLHMILCKLLDLAVTIAIHDNFEGEEGILEREKWAGMLSGFFICIVELCFALVGRVAFPVDLYPPAADFSNGLPLDFAECLELNGIDVEKWDQITALIRTTTHWSRDPTSVRQTPPANSRDPTSVRVTPPPANSRDPTSVRLTPPPANSKTRCQNPLSDVIGNSNSNCSSSWSRAEKE